MPSEPRSRRDRHAVQAAHGESPVQLVLTPEKLDALYAVSTRAQQPCFVEVDVLLLIDRAEKSARLAKMRRVDRFRSGNAVIQLSKNLRPSAWIAPSSARGRIWMRQCGEQAVSAPSTSCRARQVINASAIS